MSGRNIVKLILDEARTKPVIADLVARVETMTPEEFASLTTPLPWHKKALAELRKQVDQQIAQGAAESYVEAMGDVIFTPPQKGAVVRHTGLDTPVFPPARAGRPMSILIKTGDILFVTRTETWHGSLSVGMPQIAVEVIQRDATREDYFRHYEREAPSMDLRGATPQAGEMHQSGLFRIMR